MTLEPLNVQIQLSSSPVRSLKRKYDEIPDSQEDSDEYGWDDEYELVAEGLVDDGALHSEPREVNLESSSQLQEPG